MSAVETRRFSCGGASFSFQVWKAPAAEASAADLAPDEGCAIAAACRESAVPLILLHGFAQSSASWNATASELAATGRPVYALDLVGHGGSERPANPRAYALDAQGEALLAFARVIADAEGVRPAVLGYSMGGRVTLAALHSDPRAFSAVILEAAGFGSATQAEREAAAKRDAACATRLRRPARRRHAVALPGGRARREVPRPRSSSCRSGCGHARRSRRGPQRPLGSPRRVRPGSIAVPRGMTNPHWKRWQETWNPRGNGVGTAQDREGFSW